MVRTPALPALPAPLYRRMLLSLLWCSLTLASCGGGGSEPDAQPSVATAPNAGTLALGAGSISLSKPAAVDAAGDLLMANPRIHPAQELRSLADAVGDANAALRGIGASTLCRAGFNPPADLMRTSAAPLLTNGGVFFNAKELATWRSRVQDGPFINDGDFAPSSPGDWSRISANARAFLAHGEALGALDDAARASHGQLARDAAFAHLLKPDAKLLAAVRGWLLAMAAAPANDFTSSRCYRALDGSERDGWFAEPPWFLRYLATYDFVRNALPEADRVAIENYLRRNAWFFAAQLDWGLQSIFPQRQRGDYSVRASSAAASGEDIWWNRRVDSNADCSIDERDEPKAWPVYAYARADGSYGPRVPWLALWFNNRRAANSLAAGAAGVLLAEGELVLRAKRYTMEWLSYGVSSDGSSGEYGRNGEYCIARQGLIYASLSLHSGTMLARVLARQGDRTLMNFSTRAGLFGTESGNAGTAKTLALAADTLLRASSGSLGWYQAEPQRAGWPSRAQVALGRMQIHYMGSAQVMDDFHELTLMSAATVLPMVPVLTTLLKHPAITQSAANPGSPRIVATGLGAWSDVWGILPAAYLLRPLTAASTASQ